MQKGFTKLIFRFSGVILHRYFCFWHFITYDIRRITATTFP
jgi:hypothetical protein